MYKSILLTIFLLLGASCSAIESIEIDLDKNYILSTQRTVESLAVSKPDIVSVSPFFTIFNEKNVILIQPIKAGKFNLTVFTDKEDSVFEIIIKPAVGNKELPELQNEDFELFLLDVPPIMKEIKIDKRLIKPERDE